MRKTKPIVSYIRVSTKRQGQSGLGEEAQRQLVSEYAGNAKIVAEYREVESGKRSDRPKLAKALAHAKSINGVLVVAKLDRLARNVAFVSALMESGVDFVAADMPDINRLTIHILAAVAEDEAARISARTKAALAVAKARGVKLGSSRKGHWKGLEERRLAGAKLGAKRAATAHQEAADEFYNGNPVVARIRDLHGQGKSLRSIAAVLNEEGLTARRGGVWNASQVRNTLSRIPD